jgi:hypothetical protein
MARGQNQALGTPLTRAHNPFEGHAVARQLDQLAVVFVRQPFDPPANPEGLAAVAKHLGVEPTSLGSYPCR